VHEVGAGTAIWWREARRLDVKPAFLPSRDLLEEAGRCLFRR